MSTAAVTMAPAMAPASRRVRAYFAPVARATETPTIYDPAQAPAFAVDAPPAPWIDLGYVRAFTRKTATKVQGIATGAPAGVQFQTRDVVGATVSLQFEQWTKLTMALAAGSQHMNVLAGAAGAAANGSGSKAAAATALASAGSLANFLELNAGDLAKFSAGQMVAVDVDYAGQTGFVGSGVSAAYVRSAASVGSDPDYVRRVTLNVGRVTAVTSTGLQLAGPLLAGIPAAGMKAQAVLGFVDREGGTFFQEWSALFVLSGEQGDQVLFHYPRLQAMAGAAETSVAMLPGAAGAVAPLAQSMLDASFCALPVVDGNDGESVYCFRTYVPAGSALV
jgi:hypothetical protein